MRAFRTIRIAPLTVGLVWLACAIFIGTYFKANEHGVKLDAARRDFGAAVPLTKIMPPPGEIEPRPVEGFTGPFDVWNSARPQWWRYFFNGLHHGDLMHLIFNGWALILLGRIIEPRMKRLPFACFLIMGCFVTMLPDALSGNHVIGLSGVAYAMVGMLMVWREQDEAVARECPQALIVFAGIWLLLAQLLTYVAEVPIANQAHFAGLIYGWMWGQAYLGERERLLSRFLFAVGHLLLIPAVWFLIHPFWNGAWHWYLAEQDGITYRRRIERLQTAVLRDPSLAIAWRTLSGEFIRQDDLATGFRVALQGLRANRTHPELRELVTAFWLDFDAAGQTELVESIVTDVFGDEAEIWRASLHARVDPLINYRSWTAESLGGLFEPPPVLSSALDQFSPEPPAEKLPEIDPNAPDSALEGEFL